MTKEERQIIEAIKIMGYDRTSYPREKVSAVISMAIEALSEPKTIISIDIPYGSDKGIATIFKGKDEKLMLEEVKVIMSVVRCKDYKHWYADADTGS